MKKVTREEAIDLLEKIGHLSNIEIKLKDEHYDYWRCVLNNGVVYNPYHNGNHSSTHLRNAIDAAGMIVKNNNKEYKNKFKVYSNYYNWANGDYEIVF